MKKDWTVELRARTAVVLLCLTCVAAVGAYQHFFPSTHEQAPQVGRMDDQGLIARGCILHQTLHYALCGHSVERKIDAPDTVLGLNRELFEQAMNEWRITAFAAQRIEMSRTMEMPCPAHWVIMADESGKLGMYRNLYGEELLCLRRIEIGVSAAPEGDQMQLRRGMCFDSAQEAEVYLEAIQS